MKHTTPGSHSVAEKLKAVLPLYHTGMTLMRQISQIKGMGTNKELFFAPLNGLLGNGFLAGLSEQSKNALLDTERFSLFDNLYYHFSSLYDDVEELIAEATGNYEDEHLCGNGYDRWSDLFSEIHNIHCNRHLPDPDARVFFELAHTAIDELIEIGLQSA